MLKGRALGAPRLARARYRPMSTSPRLLAGVAPLAEADRSGVDQAALQGLDPPPEVLILLEVAILSAEAG
jgi:hypothetical protein